MMMVMVMTFVAWPMKGVLSTWSFAASTTVGLTYSCCAY